MKSKISHEYCSNFHHHRQSYAIQIFVLCLRQCYPCVLSWCLMLWLLMQTQQRWGRPVCTTLTVTQSFLLNDPPRRVQANVALAQLIFEGWRKYWRNKLTVPAPNNLISGGPLEKFFVWSLWHLLEVWSSVIHWGGCGTLPAPRTGSLSSAERK